MDSNVAKNTFLYKFFKLDFANKKLGIKQLLQQQLLQAIYLYRQQNKILDSWDSIIVSLPDKLILRNINNHKIATKKDFTSASFLYDSVYRCAIAFPLANSCGIKPLEMAQKLVSFFPEVKLEEVTKLHLKVMIKVIPPGWIDFKIKHNFLGIWLQQLILELEYNHSHRIEDHPCHKNLQFLAEKPNLFPVNYYYARCCSLLKLGEREELIKLDNHNFLSLSWQISKPNPILWFDVAENFLLTHPQELNLLHSILLILDQFGDRLVPRQSRDRDTSEALRDRPKIQPTEEKIWLNYALDLSEAFEQFIIACRFCGKVKHQNPQLAVARLGLIALVKWCLYKLLWEKLKIIPLCEL